MPLFAQSSIILIYLSAKFGIQDNVAVLFLVNHHYLDPPWVALRAKLLLGRMF